MNLLREARKRKEEKTGERWSQMRVAQELGVHVQTYRIWEGGGGNPSPENKKKLKKVLGIECDDLIILKDQKRKKKEDVFTK